MKKLFSSVLVLAMLSALFTSCSAPADKSATASDDEVASFKNFLCENLSEMPNTLVIGDNAKAADYGIDMSEFSDDGFFTCASDGEVLIFGKTDAGLDRAVRDFVKHGNCDVYTKTYGEGYRVKKLTIAGRDISEYSILLFDGADECHTTAATELQKYIDLACGVKPDIVYSPTNHMIVLEKVGEDDPRSEVLGREGFNISVRESGDLYISGGRDRGCLYGVYELLESYIGWRFAANGEVLDHNANENDYYLYEADHIDIPAGLEDEQIPSFDYRQGRLYAGNHKLYYSDLPIILRENDRIRGDKAYNGYGFARGGNHGLLSGPFANGYCDDLFDPDVIKGKRQPCFSNEDFLERCKEYYTEYVESRLEAGDSIGEELVHIDIAQVDSMEFCMCEDCIKYMALDGSETGPMLHFSNEMARYFGEKYPGLYLSILIYWGTAKPPKTTVPEPNLNCSFCFFTERNFSRCMNHSINGKECDKNCFTNNAIYAEWFEKWCEISEMVTVWYYPGSWYYNNISTNLIDTLRADIAYMAQMGIHGMYPCMWLLDYWTSQDALIGYLIDELQWNADMTNGEYRELIYEYLCILYGHDSAPYLMEYLDWAESIEKEGCFTELQFSLPNEKVYFDKVSAQKDYALELLDMALKNAESAADEEAITLFIRPAYFTILIATHTDMYLNGTEEERAWYETLYNNFKNIALSTDLKLDGVLLTEEDFDIEKNPGSMYEDDGIHKVGWWPN